MIDFCVLGSGISGSTIANLLSKKYTVEVIDKANGVGGRASNKKINNLVSFDHGLQYFSTKDINFKNYLNHFIKKRILKYWNGNHIDLTLKKEFQKKKIIGVKGNNDLNKFLLKRIKKNLNNEIKYINFKNDHWEILGNKKRFTAKNIIITFPYEQTKKLAKKYLSKKIVDFKIKMQPNITLMVIEKNKKKVPLSSLKLDNSIISWIANENSKKRFKYNQCLWTIQTDAKFSKKIINIYKKNKFKYSNIILKEFSNLLGIKNKSLKIYRIHGWKYSHNNYKSSLDSSWNNKYKIGICGDWFLGPKAEHAWLSASKLFNKIKKNPPK